jgi:O-acetyl-ADP-ribose deacetylase (regulator of RNase III)
MIRSVRGNLLSAEVDALVNTVNTVGVMGKGIAVEFKRAFPDNVAALRDRLPLRRAGGGARVHPPRGHLGRFPVDRELSDQAALAPSLTPDLHPRRTGVPGQRAQLAR